MAAREQRISVEHDGKTYSGSYTVESGVLQLTMTGPEGTHVGPMPIILRGTPEEACLRMLLREYFGSPVTALKVL